MPAPPGYIIRFPKEGDPVGKHGSIAFKDKEWKAFQKDVIPQTRAKLEVTMKAWTKDGPANLPPQKFTFELQYEKGGKNARIDAFKGWQVRIYGTTMQVDAKPMFLVTGIDVAKKQDKADPAKLNAAGDAAHNILHASSNRQKK